MHVACPHSCAMSSSNISIAGCYVEASPGFRANRVTHKGLWRYALRQAGGFERKAEGVRDAVEEGTGTGSASCTSSRPSVLQGLRCCDTRPSRSFHLHCRVPIWEGFFAHYLCVMLSRSGRLRMAEAPTDACRWRFAAANSARLGCPKTMLWFLAVWRQINGSLCRR